MNRRSEKVTAGGREKSAGVRTIDHPKGQSASRKRWLRAIAVLSPLGVLLLLELILRVGGWGYPINFFRKSHATGRAVWIENQEFSRRYFPPGLERTPQPLLFATRKPSNTLRIFVFGESAALGDPEPAFGLARILKVLLEEALPGKRIEIINTAVTAINSHAIREIAKESTDKEGDFWIVYMGHNEVVGPFGAGTVFGGQSASLPLIRANLALKSTRVGQWLEAMRQRFSAPPTTPSWEGMEMFLQHQITADDPRRSKWLAHFENNLHDIVRFGTKAGARLVVSSVAANLKDCPPFASKHRADLSPAEQAEWENWFEAGQALEKTGNRAAALTNFQQAARLDSHYAEVWFRMGQIAMTLGDAPAARTFFERALEYDTLRFRADPRLNESIQTVARSDPKVRFVDCVEVLARHSPFGLPGKEFLYEHVHLNFAGNYLIARAFAEQILETATNGPPLLSEEECARHLAFTEFDRYRVLDEVRQRLQRAPFAQQLDHASRDEAIKSDLARMGQASLHAAFQMYERAIARSPDDWVLRENFATLLQDFDEMPRARAQWRKVIELMPHYADGHFYYGLTLREAGRFGEAVREFRAARRSGGWSGAKGGARLPSSQKH